MRLALLVVLITLGVVYGQEKYEERCTIVTGNGVSVDSCDAKKFLSCQTGYCKCNDPTTQLYDYRYEEQRSSRTRRSPKKGSSGKGSKKGVGAGTGAVVGGVVGGVAGYQLGKAVAGGGNSGSTSYSSSSSSSKSSLKKEYSCYGRVGSQCVYTYNNINIVSLDSTTTATTTPTVVNATTTPASNSTAFNSTASNSTADSNVTTTTTATPVAPSASPLMDITKIPKCVRNAVCQRPQTIPSSNSTNNNANSHIVKVDGDPRLGVCACAPGYVATKTDQCKKVTSGATNFNLGISVVLFAVVSKLIQ